MRQNKIKKGTKSRSRFMAPHPSCCQVNKIICSLLFMLFSRSGFCFATGTVSGRTLACHPKKHQYSFHLLSILFASPPPSGPQTKWKASGRFPFIWLRRRRRPEDTVQIVVFFSEDSVLGGFTASISLRQFFPHNYVGKDQRSARFSLPE